MHPSPKVVLTWGILPPILWTPNGFMAFQLLRTPPSTNVSIRHWAHVSSCTVSMPQQTAQGCSTKARHKACHQQADRPPGAFQRDIPVCIFHILVLVDNLPWTSQQPLGGQQTFHTHRPSCMDPPCTDANLRPKTKTEAIRKPCWHIMKGACAVHPLEEIFPLSCILSYNCVCVVGPKLVDVLDGFVQWSGQFQSDSHVTIFMPLTWGGGQLEEFCCVCAAIHLHTCFQ